jgi:hypothetical protein
MCGAGLGLRTLAVNSSAAATRGPSGGRVLAVPQGGAELYLGPGTPQPDTQDPPLWVSAAGSSLGAMMFWQLTIDANDPTRLARFWARALGYQPVPPTEPETTWHALYRARLGEEAAFDDRLFDPAGLRPPIWFQQVPETKAGKNRLHLDLYPTGRDNTLPMDRRIEIVEAKVAELVGLGASVERRTREDDPEDPVYFVVMHDPEGNEFCVG